MPKLPPEEQKRRNAEMKRKRRMDQAYREQERARNRVAQRVARMDLEYREKEREKDRIAKRLARMDENYRENERMRERVARRLTRMNNRNNKIQDQFDGQQLNVTPNIEIIQDSQVEIQNETN